MPRRLRRGLFTQDGKFQFVTWQLNAKLASTFASSSETNLQFPPVALAPRTPLAQTDKLCALSDGSSVRILSKNGGSSKTFPMEARDVAELELSPDGRFLAARTLNGAVQLWNAQTQDLVFQTELNNQNQRSNDFFDNAKNLHDVAFSSDNRLWAYARPNGASTVVELRTLEAVPRLVTAITQNEAVTALKFSPDNKALICGDDAGRLQWLDVKKRAVLDSAKTGEAIFDIVFGARSLVVMGSSATRLYNVPANAKKPLQNAVQSKLPSAFDTGRDAYTQSAISPDGKLLATAQGSESVQVWDLTTETKLQDLQRDSDGLALIYGLKFSADSIQLSAVGQEIKNRQVFTKTWRRTKAK